ncbi:JmjC domain-containing protein [Nonomuraea zeae]|uniref:JmjC domain-containing protein n=1 Tax=Nonomuraea zeae TaxID=1642303 RepID=UPI00361C8EFD
MAARVQTVAFLTSPDHFGTRAHRGGTHVFVIQAEGSKRWTLYDVPAGDDWDLAEIPSEDAVTKEVELRAGEGLYVPLGMGHRARAGSQGSLHLSVMVNPPRLREVVQAWAAQVSAAFTGRSTCRSGGKAGSRPSGGAAQDPRRRRPAVTQKRPSRRRRAATSRAGARRAATSGRPRSVGHGQTSRRSVAVARGNGASSAASRSAAYSRGSGSSR